RSWCFGGNVTAQRPTLLVIDDEEDMREMLAYALEDDGFEVVAVSGGAAALEKASHQAFDLAVTDLKMPDMDGVETLTGLKAMHPAMEVIIATGYASEETRLACMDRGAYGYLRKPYDLMQIKSLLWRAFQERQHRPHA